MDTSLRVLVVDDQDTVRRLVMRLLQRCGFHAIDEAKDGAAAHLLLHRRRYGLVVADVEMHGIGGIALLEIVRADERLRDTCFVLMSGHRDPLSVFSARLGQVDAYLLKPFTAERLMEKLRPLPKLQPKMSTLLY